VVSEGTFTLQAGVSRTHARIGWMLAPLAVGLGTLVVAAVALWPFRSLSTDEAVAVDRARQPFGDVLHTIAHHEPAQTGYLLTLKAATLAGTDERTLRAASVLALAVAAALMVVLATLLLGRVEGLIAGVALGANAGAVAVSVEAAPYALGLLGVVVATLLLVAAVECRSPWLWALYAIACVVLPLTHPLAASVLLAHAAALVVRPRRRDAGAGVFIAAAGLAVAAVIVVWLALDRLDAPDGTGGFDLGEVGNGLIRAAGWSPLLAVAAIAGLAALLAGGPAQPPAWKSTLVAGLVAAPVVVTIVAAAALPVFPTTALIACAPGIALAAGAAYRLVSDSTVLWIAASCVLAVSAVTVGAVVASEPEEDWRALAAAARHVRGPRETIVVLPERSRAAFAYYAPYMRTSYYARGDGAWVAVVADGPASAIALGRRVVRTPRYALLRQFRYGDHLRLQHWVRP
jgi:mannosyltransferase